MKILINGKEEVLHSTTLKELLDSLGHDPESVATAVNQEFVSIDKRSHHDLADGDSIDIIAPMSGG